MGELPSRLVAIQKTFRSLTWSLGPPAATAVASNSMATGPARPCLNHRVSPAGVSMSSTPSRATTVAGCSASSTQFSALAKSSAYRSWGRAGCTAQPLAAANEKRARASLLVDVPEDAIELIERVVADHDLSLAGSGVLDLHRRAEFLGELVLQALHVRIEAFRRVFANRGATAA